MAIMGRLENYTKGNDALQREKRMNEWIRAMSMNPAQREAIHARMIADPYDRDATTRLERANLVYSKGANARPYELDPVSTRGLSAWQQAMEQDEAGKRAVAMATQATPARMARQAAGQAPDVSPVGFGEVNGRQMAVPTAGNYMNNAFQSHLAGMGLREGASPEQYMAAKAYYSVDPKERMAQEAETQRERYKADKENDWRRYSARQDTIQAQILSLAKSGESGVKLEKLKTTMLGTARNQDYKNYKSDFRNVMSQFDKFADPEDIKAALDSQGVPYETIKAGGEERIIMKDYRTFEPPPDGEYYTKMSEFEAMGGNEQPAPSGGGLGSMLSGAARFFLGGGARPQQAAPASPARPASPAQRPAPVSPEPVSAKTPRLSSDASSLARSVTEAASRSGKTPEQVLAEATERIKNNPEMLARFKASADELRRNYGDRWINALTQ